MGCATLARLCTQEAASPGSCNVVCLRATILVLQFFTQDSLDFQERISQRNGLGNCTSFPPSLHEEPPNCNMITAREEAEIVLFGVVQEVLDKTGQLALLLMFADSETTHGQGWSKLLGTCSLSVVCLHICQNLV